jgi:voltage-gated sodium channel
VDIFLLVFFSVEIVARLFVYRGAFFTEEHKEWNMFDLFLVVFGVIDQGLTRTLLSENSNAGARHASRAFVIVRAVRVLRIFRVLRVLRVLEICPTMRGLAVGLINGARAIGWLSLFMMVCICMYSIFLTKFLDADSFSDLEEREIIEQSFGSVSASMFTLFDWLTFDDWSTTARIVNARYWWMELVWISYFVLTQWTFMSLVTGLTVAKMEEERSVHIRDQAETYLALLFDEMDHNDDHTLDLSEFKELVESPQAQEALMACGIKISSDSDKDETEKLFFCLDKDDSGSLTLGELKRVLKMMANNRITGKMMELEGTLLGTERRYLDRYCRDAEFVRTKSMWHKVDSLHGRAMSVKALLEHLESEVQALVEQIQLADQ